MSALPVKHLSVTSIGTYLKCSERWRRRYMENDYEPPSAPMLAGRAAGAAETQHYGDVIDGGEGLSKADVGDAFNDAWKLELERQGDEVDWSAEKPESVRSTSQGAVEIYHTLIAPDVKPIAVEREAVLRIDEADWAFKGYIDLETEDRVRDLKLKSKRMSPNDALTDIQPDAYLALKRAEGNPAAGFDYDCMIRTKTPKAEVVPTERSDDELDQFLERIVSVADDITMRVENDQWQGAAPGSWWCSAKFCPFWSSCRFGGLARTRATKATKADKPKIIA